MSTSHDICLDVRTDPRGDTWETGHHEHVAGCAACRAFLDSMGELGRRLKALPGAGAGMPSGMRMALLGQVEMASRPARTPFVLKPVFSRVLIPTAMAACLVLGIALEKAFDFGEGLPVEVDRDIGMYIEDVTHDHFLLERIGRPLEVAITDQAELGAWLSESLAFAFDLPTTDADFRLEGGRVWHTVGRLSAMASYRTPSGERVVLFAVPAANLAPSGASAARIGDRTVFRGAGWEREAVVWFDGDLALALVAPKGALPDSWDENFLR